ncbi:two-component regulator propeller domain-containing protein [Undibacterium sp. Di24W]|uniref:two-component regulator propeller domain-containing protein n=1 Tax=Undibacterium sp. Di24W TaxID=3413033 RepID=UPI003BF03E8F
MSRFPSFYRQLGASLTGGLLLCVAWSGVVVSAQSQTLAQANRQSGQAVLAPLPTWRKFADTVFHRLSTQNGLPQYSATAIAQDGDGFIWVGTQGGLARWDGYRFRNYLPVQNDANSLPDNYVMSLYTDPLGQIWVGTNGGGLARYDRKNDRFIRIPIGPQAISHVTINAIIGDGKNGMWLATRGGLNHYDPDSGKFQQFHADSKQEASLSTDFVRALTRDKTGSLWIGTSQGLMKQEQRDVGSTRFKSVRLPMEAGKVQRIVSLACSQDGKIWIGTFDAGAFYIDPKDGIPHRLLLPQPDTNQLLPANDNIFTIRETAENEIWLGTYGKGVVIVNSTTLESKRLLHEASRSTSLADNSVWSIFRDRSGLIWVGSQRGISLHDPSSSAFFTLFGSDRHQHGLVGIDFFSASGMSDGSVWIGSQNHGISILHPGSERFQTLIADDSKPMSALPQSAIFSIFQSQSGKVYIGTDKGMYRSDLSGENLQKLNLVPRNPGLRVAAMLELSGKLLIGGPEGLWEKDLTLDEDKVMQPVWAKPVANKFITDLQRAPDGAIWVGTSQDGIYRIELDTGAMQNFKPDPKNEHSLSHRNASALLFDSRGWLWIAMQGGGLELLRTPNGKTDAKFIHLRKEQGLQNDLVNKVLEDTRGDIWVSTDEGLAKVNPDTLKITAITEPDGVAISGYWSNSGARLPQGDLIFGGVGGVTVVRPSFKKEYKFDPPVVITSIQAGGKTIAANQARFLGTNPEKLVINPDANSMIIEFAALDYSAPERNHYAYKLEGYDKDWIETDYTRRLAAYTNLSPGDYRLLLRGSNRSGAWSEQIVVLPIRVMPAWFQTWWAYTSYFLVISTLVVGLIRWRLWRLANRNHTLELLVQQRTQELEVSRQLLEQQSLTDHLTGLRNRRYLNLCIDEDVALVNRAYQGLNVKDIDRATLNIDIIFMMVDIDYFKSVNDEFGHAAGDLVLIETTKILKDAVRETDIIIRWGGEEFLIVARNANYLEAEVLAERIRTRIAEHDFVLPDGKVLHKTCSIGLATYPFIPTSVEAFTWEQVVDIADQCLYAAKRGGRNAWTGLFLLGSDYSKGHITDVALEVEQQIAQGHIVVKTSLPTDTPLDWSHGRDRT